MLAVCAEQCERQKNSPRGPSPAEVADGAVVPDGQSEPREQHLIFNNGRWEVASPATYEAELTPRGDTFAERVQRQDLGVSEADVQSEILRIQTRMAPTPSETCASPSFEPTGKARVKWVLGFRDAEKKQVEELGCSSLSSGYSVSAAPSQSQETPVPSQLLEAAAPSQLPEAAAASPCYQDTENRSAPSQLQETPAPSQLAEIPEASQLQAPQAPDQVDQAMGMIDSLLPEFLTSDATESGVDPALLAERLDAELASPSTLRQISGNSIAQAAAIQQPASSSGQSGFGADTFQNGDAISQAAQSGQLNAQSADGANSFQNGVALGESKHLSQLSAQLTELRESPVLAELPENGSQLDYALIRNELDQLRSLFPSEGPAPGVSPQSGERPALSPSLENPLASQVVGQSPEQLNRAAPAANEVAGAGIAKVDFSVLNGPSLGESVVNDISADETARLDVLFVTDANEEQQITFTKTPLGMIIKKSTTAVTVARVVDGGHAHELGVQVGWRVQKIDGKDVTSMEVPTEAFKDFMVGSSPRNSPKNSLPTLTIEFKVKSEVHAVVFTNSPLGLDLNFRKAFTVNAVEPSSYAYACGVRSGWRIMKVGDEDVRSLDWPLVCRRIAEKARNLPHAKGVGGEHPCG